MQLLVWMSLVAAGVIYVDTMQQFSKSAPYGPLCWGPGIWPHPEHCRLFTICQLKYQVKGQLFACPADTGFSIKHLMCMPEAKVPGCRLSSPFSETKLLESTAIKFSNVSVKPDHNLCYKNKTSTPFCMDDVTLVVCGPREAFMGTVDCSSQSEVILGRCDKDTKSCTLEEVSPQDEEADHRPTPSVSTLPSSSLPPLHEELRPSPSPPPPSSGTSSSHLEDHQLSPTVAVASTPSPLDEDHHPTPIHFGDLQNITAALLEEIANSNLTLFNKDKHNGSSTIGSPVDENMITTSEGPQPTLPSTSEISCKLPGLQCYDNVTIMDCPDDDTEPNFVMSCSNIIQTAENATGYCNPENPSCVLLIENFMLNMEISSFNFGESDNNQELGFADMDEDYEGPELYDSDNLRESPDDIFDGLSWFRHEPKGSRDVDSPEEYSVSRRGKDVPKLGTDLSENQKEKYPKGTFGKFESHETLGKAFHADLLREIKSATLGGGQPDSFLRGAKSLGDQPVTSRKIKRAQTIEARPEAREVFEQFLAKCEQGGLFCYDNTTLVACSEDADSQTYAVQCYGEATSPNGRRLEAYCDQTTDSCVVNVRDDEGAEDTITRNVQLVDTLTSQRSVER